MVDKGGGGEAPLGHLREEKVAVVVAMAEEGLQVTKRGFGEGRVRVLTKGAQVGESSSKSFVHGGVYRQQELRMTAEKWRLLSRSHFFCVLNFEASRSSRGEDEKRRSGTDTGGNPDRQDIHFFCPRTNSVIF